MVTKRRVWGLYSYLTKSWIESDGRRTRFETPEQAHEVRRMRYIANVVPRPFYVKKKPNTLPPEAAAVIDAARFWVESCRLVQGPVSVGGIATEEALKRYDASKA
jgi:hypothetical protein